MTRSSEFSPFDVAARAVGGPRRAAEELERDPVLRSAMYEAARRIAIKREARAIRAAQRDGVAVCAMWPENRPVPRRRRLRFCSNCETQIRLRCREGRCRECAKYWVRHGRRAERVIGAEERRAHQQRRASLDAPHRAVAWIDPTLNPRPVNPRCADTFGTGVELRTDWTQGWGEWYEQLVEQFARVGAM